MENRNKYGNYVNKKIYIDKKEMIILVFMEVGLTSLMMPHMSI
mgnify:CR=1 FL=1